MGSFVEYVGIFDFSVSGSAVIGFEDSFDNQTMQLACSYSCFCSEDAPSPRSLAHPPRYLASESPTLMNLYEVAGFTTLWVDDGRDLRFVAYRTSYGLSIGDGASDIEYTGDGDSHTYRVVTPVVAKLGGEAYIQLEGIDQEGTETPSQNLNCYVNQAPELKLEEAGWEDVQYVVRFSIDDPDFVTTPERYRESVTLSIGAPQCDEPDWGVVGGEGWTSSYVSDTEGITLYVEPLGDGACRAECSLEVRATDANGFTDTLLISVPPALCAIDSSVSAKLGSVVDLTMGCTNPEAYPDSVLTYQLGEVDLDGIGRISGTPPDCTLSILATNCHDEVVIPYTIR